MSFGLTDLTSSNKTMSITAATQTQAKTLIASFGIVFTMERLKMVCMLEATMKAMITDMILENQFL